MTKTIIFDYDGTIHHTLGIYEPAFRETYQWLTEQKVTEEREIGSVEIAGWLGLNSKEMWNTFCRSWIRAIKSRQADGRRSDGKTDQET